MLQSSQHYPISSCTIRPVSALSGQCLHYPVSVCTIRPVPALSGQCLHYPVSVCTIQSVSAPSGQCLHLHVKSPRKCSDRITKKQNILSVSKTCVLLLLTESKIEHPTTLRSAHTVYLCVLCGSQNKQLLFPYTTLTDWFL
jgi:hypothetical protein